MERMMTGDGRVRTFAECRNRRNRRTLLRVSVVLGVLLAAILALLFCLGRFAGRGPFAPGVAQAKYSPSSWSLIVVNRWNRIPGDYPAPKLTRLSNGESVDSRIYPDLQRMFDDMRAAGLHPEVTSAYRTEAVQRQLLDEKIFLYQNEGASKEEARRQASQWWPSRGPASTSWAWRWTSTRAGPPAPRTAATSTSGLQTTRGGTDSSCAIREGRPT